ncbi:MAG TPA: acyl carrier protein [Xanthobacteraceae bacterium]|jgi:acyl carrier protein
MRDERIKAAIRLVATVLEMPASELGPDSSMENVPAWDSVEHINILLSFQQQFRTEIDLATIATATSIRALAELLPDFAARVRSQP